MRSDSRKAQFATEFMMTYGWAMIGIAAIFAALYAFGILDVKGILPEKCSLTPGFSCRDYTLSPDQLIIQLTNGIGKKIVVDRMQGAHKTLGTCQGAIDTAISNGDTQQITFPCPLNLPVGGKEQLDINFTYYFEGDSAFMFSARGQIFAKVG